MLVGVGRRVKSASVSSFLEQLVQCCMGRRAFSSLLKIPFPSASDEAVSNCCCCCCCGFGWYQIPEHACCHRRSPYICLISQQAVSAGQKGKHMGPVAMDYSAKVRRVLPVASAAVAQEDCFLAFWVWVKIMRVRKLSDAGKYPVSNWKSRG